MKTSAIQDSDYWLEEKRLHILLYSFNPDEGGAAPPIEYVFDLRSEA